MNCCDGLLLFLDSISSNYYITLAYGSESRSYFSRHHEVDVRRLERISAPYVTSTIDL